MTTLTKLAIAPLSLAAAASLSFAAPALAAENSEDIIVTSAAAMEQWQAATTKDLNRSLAREPITRKVSPNNSVVEVAFTLGADGRAQNIKVIDGDGNWSARRAAIRAVRTLDTLDEVPVRNPVGTRFLASIIFADSAETKKTLAKKAKKARAARFAAADQEQYILLGG